MYFLIVIFEIRFFSGVKSFNNVRFILSKDDYIVISHILTWIHVVHVVKEDYNTFSKWFFFKI